MKIGFTWEQENNGTAAAERPERPAGTAPRKSVVQVRFPGRGAALSYYNDRFDLRAGDLVYVDGKLEGIRGQVISVTYNFRIRLSDYKRVIAVIDTDVKGQFYPAGRCFVSFDRAAIPPEKIASWFIPPCDDVDFVCSTDDSTFRLDDLAGMDVSPAIAERGLDYYRDEHVEYLCLDGARGYAIVAGTEHYEVEFRYRDGEISGLICSCFCSYACKHEVAVMLQLREMLSVIEEKYREQYAESGYFAVIRKRTLLTYAVEHGEKALVL